MKCHILLFLGISFLFFTNIFSQQEPPLLWIKSYGGSGWDYGRSIVQTSDGGFFAAGYKETWRGGNHIFLMKLNANGDSLWAKVYGKPDQGMYYEKGYSSQQTFDGGFIITGESRSFDDIKKSYDVSLVRTDSLGDTLWTKAIGTENNETGFCVEQTNDSGFIISGMQNTDDFRIMVVFLIRTDSYGDTLWTKTYLDTSYAQSVAQTVDGGFIVSGYSSDGKDGNAFLLKTDSNGDSVWVRYYQRCNISYSVQQLIDGGYVFSGYYNHPNGKRYMSIIRTDSIGDTIWTNSEMYRVAARDVYQTSEGGFVITGAWGEDIGGMFILRLDTNGKELWHKSFPHPITGVNDGFSVKQMSDGGFIALGFGAADSNDIGAPNFLFVRLDSEGNAIQNDNFSKKHIVSGYELTYDIKGNRVFVNYSIPVSTNTKLVVYDTHGREIIVLVDDFQSAGSHTVKWNIKKDIKKESAGGVYFLNLSAGDFTVSKKVTILKK